MNKDIQKDRIRGSLVGGAIGDALGYPVEFISSFEGIQRQYGEQGITRLDTQAEPNGNGKAVISDDTQMTLYTANGLLNEAEEKVPDFRHGICMAYIEWYLTQIDKRSDKYNKCRINRIPELHKRRAPGNTCMGSLYDIYRGHEPSNNSKGCGGVMRIAPIPLYAGANGRMEIAGAMKLAASASEITHKHPLGFLPSALEAFVICRLMEDDVPSVDTFKKYISDGLDVMHTLWPEHEVYINELQQLMHKAISLTEIFAPDAENIEILGEGWTAEEALAIAIYCAVKYFSNFERAVVAAVNHGGDSDSTGAVLGNILGAAVGYEAIPQHFKDNVELHDVMLHMADDLWRGEITE